ncbi:hypothetical protein TeGR_g11252, partial [Tetraparma gracilis]
TASYVVLRHGPWKAYNACNKQRNAEAGAGGGELPRACLPPPPPEPPGSTLAFDVYAPSSTFSRAAPGPPLFSVPIYLFSSTSAPDPSLPSGSTVPFPEWRGLLCATPVHPAVVAASGTVMMYKISGDPIPPVARAPPPPGAPDPAAVSLASNLPVTPSSVAPLTISSGPLTARISPYGATLLSLSRSSAPLLLSHPSLPSLLADEAYVGSTVGRVANRIAKGELSYKHPDGGKTERRTLATNNAPNHLHGGDSGFSSRVWLVTASTPSSATFALTSEDGDQGYPGAVHCVVTYSLSDAALDISFDTRVLKGCAVAGLTNHSYWNLGGGEGGCLDHELEVFADGYLPVDDTSIPTREVHSPSNEWGGHAAGMDFTSSPKKIEDAVKSIRGGSHPVARDGSSRAGVDHNYIVAAGGEKSTVLGVEVTKCAALRANGLQMTMRTSYPGVQVYTGNWLGGPFKQYEGVALEGQFFPDCVGEGIEGRGQVWCGKEGDTSKHVISFSVAEC